MKKKFTFLMAAFMLLMLITLPGMAKGQEKTDNKVYTLSIQKNNSNTSYASNYDILVNSIGWKAPGNQGLGNYIKIGGNVKTTADRFLYSKTAISGNINKVVVTHGTKDTQITVNSMTLKVYSTAADAAADSNPIATVSTTYVDNGTSTFTKPNNDDWSGCFYRINYNLSSTTTSNKGIIFTKAEFYTTTYTINYSATNGSISGVKYGTSTVVESGDAIDKGGKVTLTATPSSGTYSFSEWSVSGDGSSLTSTETNPTTFTMGTANATVTAVFVAAGPTQLSVPTNFAATPGNEQATFTWDAVANASSYTISYKPAGGAEVTVPGITGTSRIITGLTNGTTYTCKIKAVGDGESYNDSDYTSTIEVTPTGATFYTIAIDGSISGGEVSASAASAIEETEITLTKTPYAGYGFTSWNVYKTGEQATTVTVTNDKFTMPAYSVTVSATFTPYTVTLHAGTGTVNGNATFDWNVSMNSGNLPDAVSPSNDWTFAGWSTAQVSPSTTTAPSYVATAYTPTANNTLYAVYTKTTHNDVETTMNVGDYASAHGWSNGTAYNEAVVSPVTFTVTGTGNNGKYYTSNNSWRLYTSGSGVMTITSAANNVYDVSSTPSKTFTITNGQASHAVTTNTEFTAFTVTTRTTTTSYYSNPLPKVATPTFSVAEGSYSDIQTVIISCGTDDATIYYTTDGTTPTTSSTEYTSPITVNETKTIKAFAVKEGMDNSSVASATYTITTLFTMQAIYDKATNESTSVDVKFGGWVVTGASTKYAFVTDGTKGFVIYNESSHGFVAGNTLTSASAISCTLIKENGYAKITGITSSTTGLTVGTAEVPTADIAMASLAGINTGALVHYDNLSCSDESSIYYLSDGVTTLQVYRTLFSGYGDCLEAGHNYNITGVYQQYNSFKEILPRSADDIVEVEYDITLNQTSGGTIISDQAKAKFGETVTLTAYAAEHYRFSTWTVMNGDTPVSVTDNQFTMPNGNVTVEATFVPTYAITYADMEHGNVTAAPNPAAADDVVTLTISANSGYAIQTITVYETGNTSNVTPVDNFTSFTMPAYPVTIAATFSAKYNVIYHRNHTAADETTITEEYGEGADVTVAANTFAAPAESKVFERWNTQSNGEGTSYSPEDKIENIQDDIDLYAQWRDIQYHITYNVNGELSDPVDVNYGGNIATLPTASLSPYTFLGWSTTGATGPVNVTAPYYPTGQIEDITLYAVFGAIGITHIDITKDTENFPEEYGSANTFVEYTLEGKKFKIQQGYVNNGKLQWRASGNSNGTGTMYNSQDFGRITSVVLVYNSSDANKNFTVQPGKSQNPTSGNSITPSISGSTYTFDMTDDEYHYFVLTNGTGAGYLDKITINYEITATVAITNITSTVSMSEIPDNTSILVKEKGVLRYTGTNNNPQSLVVEEGGQIILTNGETNVAATMQKTIATWTGSKGDADGWYAIASPVNGIKISSFVPAVQTDDIKWNVYRYDEPRAYWNEYRSTDPVYPSFSSLTSGVGYLYRSTVSGVEFKGILNAGNASGDVACTLSYTSDSPLPGFNLLGNPFSHNISWTDMTKSNIGDGYYLLDETSEDPDVRGKWGTKTQGSIAPTQAFLVQAANGSATLTINNNPPAKGSSYANDNIMFSVANGKMSDEAYVLFKKGYGLNKIAHRNANIPMLYIIDNGENFAVADMPDNTSVINLGFEAKTIGQYTFSLKAEGQYSYMHLFDKLTGEDVDMLVEDSYSFIGAPNDRKDRFVLRLNYNAGSSTGSETEVFAYQSGNDIIVSGEGELQVFDVTGRMVMRRQINGVQTVNGLNNGVYVFRMEGKTQKIVVR